jgi:two-component system response regulator PilR (NtrC family)
MTRISEELGKPIDAITPRAMSALEAHDWPGNVRELENVIERAILLTEDRVIDVDTIPSATQRATVDWDAVPDDARTLALRKKEERARAVDRLERLFVLKALRVADWNVSAAARAVGMQRTNLHALIRRHGIQTRQASSGEDRTGGTPG